MNLLDQSLRKYSARLWYNRQKGDIVDITEKYSITRPDPYNYCLVENRIKKSGENAGEKYQSTLGYYSSLESVCHKLIDKHVDVKNMKTIIKTIKDAENAITKAINKYGMKMLKVEK